MCDKVSPGLIALKNKQREALRQQYWKQFTNPHNTDLVFDPVMHRTFVLQDAKIDFFRETPKTVVRGILLLVLPFVGTMYLFKKHRESKEALLRSGQVAYKDRLRKFN